jgi:sugar lactone lactonase YvrE
MFDHPWSQGAKASLVLSAAWVMSMWGGAASFAASQDPTSGRLPPTACSSDVALPSGSIAGDGTEGSSGDGGPATAATFWTASGTIAVDARGAVYLGDPGTSSIRRIGPDGVISMFPSGFEFPLGLAIDAAGDLYLADHLHLIDRIEPDGAVTTVAGTAVGGSAGNDGPAARAQISPTQIAVGPQGDLYFDDTNAYRTIDADGVIHAFAGTGEAGFSGDGGPATAALFAQEVVGVAADAQGNVYLGDPGNHRIRKVDAAGIITTIAGRGEPGSSGDGGPATDATIDTPVSIAIDDAGNIYFADTARHVVRRIDPAGIITTVAGSGTQGRSPQAPAPRGPRQDDSTRPRRYAACAAFTQPVRRYRPERCCRAVVSLMQSS